MDISSLDASLIQIPYPNTERTIAKLDACERRHNTKRPENYYLLKNPTGVPAEISPGSRTIISFWMSSGIAPGIFQRMISVTHPGYSKELNLRFLQRLLQASSRVFFSGISAGILLDNSLRFLPEILQRFSYDFLKNSFRDSLRNFSHDYFIDSFWFFLKRFSQDSYLSWKKGIIPVIL